MPGPQLSRDGANQINNMLAALDDISNLNLNNLAGSARGLGDHARTFLPSLVLWRTPGSYSISHAHIPVSVSLDFYRSCSLSHEPFPPIFALSFHPSRKHQRGIRRTQARTFDL